MLFTAPSRSRATVQLAARRACGEHSPLRGRDAGRALPTSQHAQWAEKHSSHRRGLPVEMHSH